jgi:hypothetical protein
MLVVNTKRNICSFGFSFKKNGYDCVMVIYDMIIYEKWL